MDGVLSGAALFFARNVVSDELFIDEAVGLHVELGKGRIDAEFLCVEEAFERHDGHEARHALPLPEGRGFGPRVSGTSRARAS